MFLNYFISKWELNRLWKVWIKMWLKHKKEYSNDFWILKWIYKTKKVLFEKSWMSTTLIIRDNTEINNFDINTFKSNKIPNKNEIYFESKSWIFNNIFKTKIIHKNLKNKINSKFIRKTELFYTKRLFYINQLSFDNSQIYCEFNFWGPFNGYIPASKFKNIIDELIEIQKNIKSQ